MSNDIMHQLKWARAKYSFQVKLTPVDFPLPTELKPKQVALRLQNNLSGEHHMIPDKSNETMYWFFSSNIDYQFFMDHVKRFFRGIDVELRVCSKIGDIL